MTPHSSHPPHLYGLTKIHKVVRPIVSSTLGAPTYHLAKYLFGSFQLFGGNYDHHVENLAGFAPIIDCLRVISSDLRVSFDVLSLLTWVPLKVVLELLQPLLYYCESHCDVAV